VAITSGTVEGALIAEAAITTSVGVAAVISKRAGIWRRRRKEEGEKEGEGES